MSGRVLADWPWPACWRRTATASLAERFDRPRPLGSGLVVQPVGMAVLHELGAAVAARQLGQPIGRMLGHSGQRVVLDVRYRPEAPGLAIHRAALFQVLSGTGFRPQR